MPDTHAQKISINKPERFLAITWMDGHETHIPFGLLRAACPCASCRGGHEKMSPEPDQALFSQEFEDSDRTKLNKVEAVGQYALSFEWADGHHFGIYTWEYLRKLCPCAECRLGVAGN